MTTPQEREPPKIVFVAPHPTQFGPPMYRQLNQSGRFSVVVYYYSTTVPIDPELGRPPAWDLPLLDGYDYRVLPAGAWSRARAILSIAMRERYSMLVVPGWQGLAYAILLIAGVLFRKPVAVQTDVVDLYGRSVTRLLLRRLALAPIVKGVRFFLPVGSLATVHLHRLGVPPDRIGWLPYLVDVQSIRVACMRHRAQRAALRRNLGVPTGATVFLAVSKIVEREGVPDLVRAFCHVAADNESVWLLLVGDGPLRPVLEEIVRAHGTRRVVFAGYQSYSSLPSFYAVADAFVHPSLSEPWGVSVQEAAACGLPLIVSSLVGSAYDLVEDGRSGFIYAGGDVGALASVLRRFASLRQELREQMGSAAYRAAQRFRYEDVMDELDRLLNRPSGALTI